MTYTLLEQIADSYPESLQPAQRADFSRVAHHLSLLEVRVPAGGRIADIGGGLGLMSVAVAAMGYDSILVDDFADDVNWRFPIATLGVHARYGVRVVSKDAVSEPLGLEPSSLDAVTSYDSIEHWHGSPKRAFHELMTALKPGGWFILSVPNCVNLRKRITVPLGFGKWTSMHDWYDTPVFRSHLREPDVDDLRYIARDLGLEDVTIHGRNWAGYASSRPLIRALTPMVDRLLRLRPSLCSNLYLMGTKPEPRVVPSRAARVPRRS